MQTGKTRGFRFPDKSMGLKIIFLILNAYVVGTQKNRCDETELLSIQNVFING